MVARLRDATLSGSVRDLHMRCSRAFAYLFLCVLLVPASASAQARTVLVLPWSLDAGDSATLAARAESVVSATGTGESSPLSIADARSRFEEHGSAEPPTMSDSDLDRWLSLSRQAVRHLAHADYTAAAATLREAQALYEPATAELNREETRARQVLDTCLYEVRALVETEDPRAETRALECRRLVPRIAPSPYNHTPEVVELLRRVDARLAAAPPGSLRLESTPTGCGVRLNGIALGVTPYVSEDVATGDYRAQVECTADGEPPSRHGRIHRIRLAEGASTVRIDVRFDSVVHTDTALRLSYATQADADEHRLEDATTAASTIGAAEVWLLSMLDGDVIQLDRVRVSSASVLASVRTHTSEGLAPAITALSSGTSQDRTGVTPQSMPAWGAPIAPSVGVDMEGTHDSSRVSRGRADWEIGLGATLGVLGIAGYAAGFGMIYVDEIGFGHLATQPLVTDSDYLTRRHAWTDWEAPSLAAGIAGGALLTAALPFVMSDEDGTPWWSWLVGGVGVAAIATGAVLTATATTCGTNARPTEACVAGTAQADDGAIVMAMGAPLLSVPIVYLIRSALGDGARASVSASNTGATLSLGGTW
jgi:hypothetical protein